MSLEIREIKDNEFQKAAVLHQKYFNNKRPFDVWKWEYKSYHPDKSVLVVINSENEIVGTQGMIPIYLNIKGEKILTGKSESTLIDEKFRGKGLFTKYYNHAIAECEKKEMQCLWGFTRIVPTLKKVDYHAYENVMKWAIMPYDFKSIRKASKSFAKSKLKSTVFSTVASFGNVYSLLRLNTKLMRNSKIETKYELVNKLKSNNDLVAFYYSLKDKYPNTIHIHQDIEFIKWRIYGHPMYKTYTFFVYNGTKLMGYMYVTLRKNQIELTDFMYQDKYAGQQLIMALFKSIPKKGIIIYSGNIKNNLNKMVFNILKSYGFILMKRPNDFILRNISFPDEKFLYNIENWYITDIWSEGVSSD